MNTKKINSISFKTLIYLILFSVSILLLLWLFQVVYFKYSYEDYQVKTMNYIAINIKDIDSNSISQNLEQIAYQNEMCIEVFWNNSSVSKYNHMRVGCALGKNNSEIIKLQNDFVKSDNQLQAFRIQNNEYKTRAYLYGIKTGSGTVFLYNTLEDLSGANIVLKNQLIYLTVIVSLFACLIAYFLSKKITEPILDITKKANSLGKGEKIKFSKYNIQEIDDLATVLNDTQDEMLKVEELRRDLLANVSHDLKTPLTMIKAYAEMVRDISYKNDEKRELHCNVIVNETDRLNILVNDILNLSKMQANVADMKLEKFDLVLEIKEIVKRYEIIKETEDYHFILNLPKNAWIKADKNKLNQVIYNLINNAINYTGEDKSVKINVKKEKDTYLVEIIDSGKGIKKEDINLIWDKYYKNDKNHQRNVVGTGIGLSIVKTILEKHHFKYGVKSEKNKGSNFYFYVKRK